MQPRSHGPVVGLSFHLNLPPPPHFISFVPLFYTDIVKLLLSEWKEEKLSEADYVVEGSTWKGSEWLKGEETRDGENRENSVTVFPCSFVFVITV